MNTLRQREVICLINHITGIKKKLKQRIEKKEVRKGKRRITLETGTLQYVKVIKGQTSRRN